MGKLDSILDRSKGEVLLELQKVSNKFKVPKTILINVKDWRKSKEIIYSNLKKPLIQKLQ